MGSKQAIAAQHLLRKAQSVARRETLPPDLLTRGAVESRFLGATGFPEAADSVAYEPTQGLLAVGTSDGRVVLIGRPGVEATLRSASRSPTQHLCFLPNKGALLRVTQDGDIQLFSAVHRKLLTSIWLQGDVINSVAVLPGSSDPYVLLGCESGNVRIVGLLDAEGQPATGARPATDLALQPYQVLGQEVDGSGGVVAVAVAHQRPDRPLLLLVHRKSGALVWDIRAERILCVALDEEGEASKPTCACWVGDRANCFAVGYDDGSILVWDVPAAAIQGDPYKIVEPADAELKMPLRVAGRGVQAGPVRSLSFLRGSASGGGSSGSGAQECLLVFGGQGKEEPDMLTLLPLVAQQAGEGGGRQVPWFGNIKGLCQMPAEGAAPAPDALSDRPRGLMILTEGGQLVIHDLKQWQPTPLTLPVQELPPMTVARLVPTVSVALLREGGAAGGSAAVSPRNTFDGNASSSGQPSPSPRGGEPPSAGSAPRQQQQQQQQQQYGGRGGSGLPQHALTLDRVRACSRRPGQAGDGGSGGEPALPEHWPFTGGQPACSMAGGGDSAAAAAGAKRHPSALYFSGHRDGRVRVWDATTQVPELLLTIPAAAGQERLRAVTAMEVDPFSGIVIVGHAGGDVRLYQFCDVPQTVQRKNIDETLIPYENVGAQPAGFQYILRYSTHSADISAVSLATKLKLAAVADESGVVSLLDLLQPAQLFSTCVLSTPGGVAQAVFGSHVIPGAGKDEPDVERVVLFLAGADSSICMVGLDRGEIIGHAMRPKNSSRPLALTLLDGSGIPLPLLHGQLLLAWANNNSLGAAAAAAAAAGGAAQRMRAGSAMRDSEGRASRLSMSERAPSSQSPLPRSSSRRSTGADSHRSWSRADSEQADAEREGSVEVHELPSDDDLDSHLAAAVQAAEEERKHRSKFKLPKAFRGLKTGTAGAGDAGEPDHLPSPSTSSELSAAAGRGGGDFTTAGSGGSFDPVGALEGFSGPGPASPGSPQLSTGLASPAEQQQGRQGQAQGPDAAGSGELFSQADLVDYQYLVDGDPTPAAYLLLCCADYLRLYAADNIRLGDRSTERKASFEAPLCFAAAFMSTHGPGVASVDTSDTLQVHSLPGLELLCRKQLEDSRVLGFRWSGTATVGSGRSASAAAAAGAICCSLDGQLVLAAPGNEIARLAVTEDCALPAAPGSVYDVRLAQQAAAEGASGRRRSGLTGGGGYSGLRVEPPEGGGEHGVPAFSPLAAAAAAGKGFGRLLDQAASTVTGLAASAADSLTQEFQRLGTGAGDTATASSRPLPTLQALFATPVEPLEDDDIDYMPESEDAASAVAATATASGAAAGAASSAALHVASSSAGEAGTSAPNSGRRLAGSLVSPREAAAKLKGLFPGARSRSERAELLEREAAAATGGAGGASGSGSQSARGAGAGGGGGGGYWAAAGKVAPYNRSASEIKRAYGHGGSSRAGEVRSIMEQNRAMLAERGERLRQLDEKTAAMSNDAEDFASLAKKLADQQAAKKWYQL